MHRRFQPYYGTFRPYGAEDDAAVEEETAAAEPATKKKKRKKKKGFEWTPEATEGAIALIGTGAKLATKAIEAKSKKGKGKKKAAEPSYTPPAPSAPSAPVSAPAGPSPVVLAVGGLVVVGGLVLFLSSQKKPQSGAGTGTGAA